MEAALTSVAGVETSSLQLEASSAASARADPSDWEHRHEDKSRGRAHVPISVQIVAGLGSTRTQRQGNPAQQFLKGLAEGARYGVKYSDEGAEAREMSGWPGARLKGGAASEPVAHARLGHQVSRVLGIRLDLLAQAGHIDVKIVNLVAVLGAPDLVQQHPVGE